MEGKDLVPQSNFQERFTAFIDKNKLSLMVALIGFILVGVGAFLFKNGTFGSSDKVEIINDVSPGETEDKKIVVEASGAVEKPGIYKLSDGSRVEDLLIVAGGISASADRDWVGKYVNRASKLTDGQKLYIISVSEQSDSGSAKNNEGIKQDQGVQGVTATGLINVNTASLQQLDSLPGIGQVYGQSIIDHRPYSDVSELLSKGALKQGVYDKVKDLVTIY